MSASNLERRLLSLEQHAEAAASELFIINDDANRPDDERLRLLGILDKPGREFMVISRVIVHPGPQPDGPLPENVSPYACGNWRYEPVDRGPNLCSFGSRYGPRRDGSEWAREF